MDANPNTTVIELDLANEAATATLAGRIAGLVQVPDVIGLSGALGAGKTAFARAFIRAGGSADEEVPSPTFTLIQTYDLAVGRIYHFDLFRIERPDAAREIGLEDAFAEGISLIEWPERLAGDWPADRLEITIAQGPKPDTRRVRLIGRGRWRDRLATAFAEARRG
ncbi:MAG: tRNA (adenosine(37)-N6)-threonylcarbamoyltransferase complex ATPase subunit type 1 TsaE [Rhodospirillales bacterium]|nr:tRNA (adenosine(37)-N6)-threonylcarbamoyltransferase complex ATPase subunit type 1 TsaE [Rhodospirillales bacterium]